MERMDRCAFVLSYDETHQRASGLAVTWLTRAAHQPPSWMVALDRQSYTLALVRSSREFVLAFATPEQLDAFLYFGTVTAHEGTDKLAASGLQTAAFAGSAIRTPLLPEAHANIACIAERFVPCGADYVLVSGPVIEERHTPGTRQLYYQGMNVEGERQFFPSAQQI